MSLALNMTSASSFQMLRGAVIIFTGLLSVAFLGRRLQPSQWIGILVTILGLVVVGLSDFLNGHGNDSHKLSEVITGNSSAAKCFQSYRMMYFVFVYKSENPLMSCLSGYFPFSWLYLASVADWIVSLIIHWFCFIGDLLIIMAQIIVSVQMVLEEKFVYKHNVHPLKAVGTEGKDLVIFNQLPYIANYFGAN